jgi:AraC-like DNA-binding protein
MGVQKTSRVAREMLEQKAIFRSQYVKGRFFSQSPPSIMFNDSRKLAVASELGYVQTWLRRVEGSEIVIGRVRSSGHSIDLQETDRLTILLPREGRLRVRIGATDHGVSPGSPMSFRPGERSTNAIAGASGLFAATTVQIPMTKLMELAEGAQLPLQGILRLDAVALRGRIEAAGLQNIKRLADDIFLRPEAPLPAKIATATADMLYEQLLVMLNIMAAPSQPRVLPAFHRVRAAEEIMHAQTEAPLSMIDLAQRLGISLRSLQLAFAEVHYGKSPRQIYNEIRLQRARQRLLDASDRDQVTKIALDAGFLHLSRFAQTYSRTFGELPSATLARRRA